MLNKSPSRQPAELWVVIGMVCGGGEGLLMNNSGAVVVAAAIRLPLCHSSCPCQ